MWWIFSQNFPKQREWVSILQASRITRKQSRNREEQFKIVGVNKLKAKLEIKHNMEANELRFHKNIIKSPMLAPKHQNRILSISKNKIEKIMNKVHTWKASSQMEAHLTSSPVFMTPPGRCPNQDLFSKGYPSNSPPPLVFPLFLLLQATLFPFCSLVSKHGSPNHSGRDSW